MMKKQYSTPELKIYSFEFESITTVATPTPIVTGTVYNSATSGVSLPLESEIPVTTEAIKYAGIQFDHNEYTME